jgi:hypothetical protein
MDLTQIVRENSQARRTILDLNLAVIVRQYRITFAQARQLQQLAFVLEAAE